MAKPKTVSVSFAILLLLLGLIAGILGGYYVSMKHYKGMKGYWYGKMKEKRHCEALTIVSPTKDQQVTDPLTVTVIVDNTKKCKWTVFEAQAGSMELKDSTGQVVGTGILTTEAEWMTEQPVEYTGTITFANPPASNSLTLTITEDDPSGQGSQQVTLPLTY